MLILIECYRMKSTILQTHDSTHSKPKDCLLEGHNSYRVDRTATAVYCHFCQGFLQGKKGCLFQYTYFSIERCDVVPQTHYTRLMCGALFAIRLFDIGFGILKKGHSIQ